MVEVDSVRETRDEARMHARGGAHGSVESRVAAQGARAAEEQQQEVSAYMQLRCADRDIRDVSDTVCVCARERGARCRKRTVKYAVRRERTRELQ